jgi:hypothetical protein
MVPFAPLALMVVLIVKEVHCLCETFEVMVKVMTYDGGHCC